MKSLKHSINLSEEKIKAIKAGYLIFLFFRECLQNYQNFYDQISLFIQHGMPMFFGFSWTLPAVMPAVALKYFAYIHTRIGQVMVMFLKGLGEQSALLHFTVKCGHLTARVDTRTYLKTSASQLALRCVRNFTIKCSECMAVKGEDIPECQKFVKYYRSLCPSEWDRSRVASHLAQLTNLTLLPESGTTPSSGPLYRFLI
ncbi:Cytochrome c oxidase subunit 6b-1 [Platanthera guangdongensis]|uniref:Cytochrome c oxidase subunit 6b-1 n=1 Tax=Platanthera guangdongensis TaxID=2320717 RepID=A0ABR2N402_9ASPA